MLFACPAIDAFFRSRIDHVIDLRRPLAVLASCILDWLPLYAAIAA